MRHGLQQDQSLNVGGSLWSTFHEDWAGDSPLPSVQLVWVDLPQDTPSPVNTFLAALTNLVRAAMVKGIPVVLTVKHTTQRDGTWKYQSFRNWRSQFNFQHTKHCFCTYGLKLHNQPFHRKMNVLSSGLSLQDSMCKKWSDGDSPLTAKDAQRLQSLERHFFTIAAKRWCSHLTCKEATSSNLDSGACTLQIDPSEDVPLEAQHGPESVREPEKAYPTDARERQKKREKLAKERGEEKSVKKRKKYVEDHYDDCGDDISSIADERQINLLVCEDSEDDDPTDQVDASYLAYMFWGSEMERTISPPPSVCTSPSIEEALLLLAAAGPKVFFLAVPKVFCNFKGFRAAGLQRPVTVGFQHFLKSNQQTT